MAVKKCKTCGDEKDDGEFYSSSPNKCKACVLKRQKALKEAKSKGGAKGKTKTKKGGAAVATAKRVQKSRATAPDQQPMSRLELPGGLGFAVELQAGDGAHKEDVHLEQTTADLGAQNIWLSPHEARSLLSWLTEKLATP